MIERVRCTDASAKQLAQISNDLLRKSKNLTRQAYEKAFCLQLVQSLLRKVFKNFII